MFNFDYRLLKALEQAKSKLEYVNSGQIYIRKHTSSSSSETLGEDAIFSFFAFAGSREILDPVFDIFDLGFFTIIYLESNFLICVTFGMINTLLLKYIIKRKTI